MKKLLSIFLAAALIIFQMDTIKVSADQNVYQSGDYKYSISNSSAVITGYTGPGGNVTLPIKIDGYTVTSISEDAFFDSSSLTSITIPSGVTNIDCYAFAFCSNLATINVDDDNTVFYSLDGVLYNKLNTTLIRYPSGKTDSTFVIPSNVTCISTHAFVFCKNLKSITIPSSLTSIGNDINKANGVFENDINLTAINVDDNNTIYSSLDGVLYDKLKTTLITYPVGKTNSTFVVPNNVTSIDNGAFRGCIMLTSVTIPNSVINIGIGAFSYCYSLTNITIPDSVTNIGGSAFCNCTSLTSITIPSSTTIIGVDAFSNCSSLTSITIPSSVTIIDADAFSNCSRLRSVIILGAVISIHYQAFDGCSSNLIIFYRNDPEFGYFNTWNGYRTVKYNIVSYDGNGNTGGTVPADNNIYTYTQQTTILGNTNNLVKTGYKFAGWNTAADGSGISYQEGTIGWLNGRDMKLYAKWTALQKYTITFNSNGGSAVNPITNVMEGTTVTLPEAPIKVGCTFAGWNTSPNGSGVSYPANTTVPINGTYITLYAQWIDIAVKGDFNADNVIDNKDLAILRGALLSSNKDIKYDINGDNKVNVNDYLRLTKMIINQPVTDNTNITGAFIDDNFRNAVYSLINKNSSSPILYSDVKNIQNLNLASMGIKDLNGLEYFTSLKSLYCNNNQLTSLNVSKNIALTTLDFSYNKILGLNIDNNTSLTYLDCNNNQLTSLDVSKNTTLIFLNSSFNKLTALDVSLNRGLTYLGCNNNQLTALDVSSNTLLTYLSCYFNHLATLDVSKNTALNYLFYDKNQQITMNSSKGI